MTINIMQLSDNVPGRLGRYLLQEVNYSPSLPICITIDGVCNHADTDLEDVESALDPAITVRTQVCTKCGEVKEG